MSGLAISKPWTALTEDEITALPAQLGVFEVADRHETIVLIGYAGGRQPFGLRSALGSILNDGTAGELFRVELTHGYLTRWEELLMVHQAVHGRLPFGNADHPFELGRLTIDGAGDGGARTART
jgi:hypothetical protein